MLKVMDTYNYLSSQTVLSGSLWTALNRALERLENSQLWTSWTRVMEKDLTTLKYAFIYHGRG